MFRGLAVGFVCVLSLGCASSNPAAGDCDPDVDDCVDAAPGDAIDGGAAFDADTTDAGPMFGFGEPCQDKGQCESDICILAGPGGICSETCVAGSCPEGYGCFGVFGAIEPGVVADVCVPLSSTLCSPCSVASECAVIGNDQCLTDDLDKSFCAQDCSSVSCPIGYSCQFVDAGGTEFQQCVPDSGACDCNASNTGAEESCDITNDFGTCQGIRTCAGATGWGGCDPPSTIDAPDAAFADDNCDGIDGDVTKGLFVATSGSDTGTCGLTHLDPCATISHGIVRALTDARGELYIQAGDYNEIVTMQNGIDLYGGYDINWERDDHGQLPHRVRIIGGLENTTNQFMTIRASSLIVPTVIADLVMVGPNASGQSGTSGKSSYAVYIADTTGLSFERVTVQAGDGADGNDGATGSNASNVNRTSGMNGNDGGDAKEFATTCNDSTVGVGGSRGTNSCSNTNGGAGGDGGTMDEDCSGFFPDFDAQIGKNGNNASVFISSSFGFRGSAGQLCSNGFNGRRGLIANGSAGAGNSGGALVGAFWRGVAGTSGGTGSHGGGGGGGGGSGGCDTGIDSHGAGGGGGAAGGCRALSGGGGGFGGGSSFGVFVLSSTVSLQTCDIVRGAAGAGGDGGVGGRGQSGGLGGDRGAGDGDSDPGGLGGDGAHGGHGGGGGGGAGGNAVGIFSSGSSVTQNCTFSGGGAGSGGSGGVSAPTAPVAEKDGNNGTGGGIGSVSTVVSQ